VKERASSLKRAALWLIPPLLLGAAGCNTKPEPPGGDNPVPRALASSGPKKPVPPVNMPGAIPQAELHGDQPVAARETAAVKYSGEVGERLEGDVYFFQVRSLKTCDNAGKVAGVEVEIEATSKLSVNPRDVVIGKGGVRFTASLDFKRELPGCTPLLQISILQKGQKARGYVLYDLPSRPTDDLRLIYQPTRFGGAGFVTAPLKDWPLPP
jgi:hypothetical protein